MWIGLYLWVGAALSAGPFDDCFARITAARAERGGWACLYDVARQTGDYATPGSYLESELGREPKQPWALFTMSNLLMDQGHPDAAAMFERALPEVDQTGDTRARVYFRLNYAMLLDDLGAPDRADQMLGESAEIAAAAGERGLFATATMQRARRMWRAGEDLGLALRLLDSVESEVVADGGYQEQLVFRHVKANLLRDVGRPVAARAMLDSLIAFQEERGDKYSAANSIASRLFWRWTDDDGSELGVLLEEARTVDARLTEMGNPYAIASALGVHAAIAAEAGEALEAESAAERGIQHAEQLGEQSLVAAAYSTQAEAAVAIGGADRLAAVPAMVAKAREALLRRPSLPVSVDLIEVELDLAISLGDAAQAGLLAEDLAAGWDRIADLSSDPTDRAGQFVGGATVMLRVAERLAGPTHEPVWPGAESLAFWLGERARAGSLRAALLKARVAPRTAELEQRTADLEGRRWEATDVLDDPDASEAEVTEALAALQQLQEQERDLQAAVQANDPLLRAGRVSAVRLEAVQSALEADEAMLVLQLSGATRGRPGWAWLITRSESVRYPLPAPGALSARIDLLNELIKTGDMGMMAAASGLSETLIGPALGALPAITKRVVVIPDGPTWRVPWGALLAAEDGDTRAFSLSASATTWLDMRGRPAPEKGGLLVLADPDAALLDGESTARLPGAAAEAERIVGRFGAGATSYTGVDATKSQLASALTERPALLHLAAHAVSVADSPQRSNVRLTPEPPNDGALTPEEIAALPLSGQVVVLSACETASGQILPGEGAVTLSRAFLMGGAGAVLGTLWPVRDEQLGRLQDLVYDGLLNGEALDISVAKAQRSARDEGLPAEAWSALVVVGDASRAPFIGHSERQAPWSWIVAAIATLGALGGLGWWAKQRPANNRTGRRR